MAELLAATIEEGEEGWEAGILEALMGCLPPEEQKRVRGFRQREDQKRVLLGAVLIRSILREKTGLEARRLILSRDAYGKPFFAGGKGIHFNLSHSGKWVVCIIDSFPAGIDVQEMRPIDIRLGKHFFSSSEYEVFLRLPEEQKLDRFYELWTLKESYMKAVGKGLSIPTASFSIMRDGGEIRLQARQQEDFFFRQYQIEKGYKLAACSRSNLLPHGVKTTDIRSLMSKIH